MSTLTPRLADKTFIALAAPLLAALWLVFALACGGDDSSAPSAGAVATVEARAAWPLATCRNLPVASAFTRGIVTPVPSIPAAQAAFSGAWEGIVNGNLVWLVVEGIEGRNAVTTLHFSGTTGGGLAEFRDNGSLHLGGRGQVTFTWEKGANLNELIGVRQEGNDTITFGLRKCNLQP